MAASGTRCRPVRRSRRERAAVVRVQRDAPATPAHPERVSAAMTAWEDTAGAQAWAAHSRHGLWLREWRAKREREIAREAAKKGER